MRRPQWYAETIQFFMLVELDGETKILPCITDGDGLCVASVESMIWIYKAVCGKMIR